LYQKHSVLMIARVLAFKQTV